MCICTYVIYTYKHIYLAHSKQATCVPLGLVGKEDLDPLSTQPSRMPLSGQNLARVRTLTERFGIKLSAFFKHFNQAFGSFTLSPIRRAFPPSVMRYDSADVIGRT